jgi:hypothetical protein
MSRILRNLSFVILCCAAMLSPKKVAAHGCTTPVYGAACLDDCNAGSPHGTQNCSMDRCDEKDCGYECMWSECGYDQDFETFKTGCSSASYDENTGCALASGDCNCSPDEM